MVKAEVNSVVTKRYAWQRGICVGDLHKDIDLYPIENSFPTEEAAIDGIKSYCEQYVMGIKDLVLVCFYDIKLVLPLAFSKKQ